MDFPRLMGRKPYIDVLDIESIPDAVEEALLLLRQGIIRAMSANVEEQRAKAAAAATSAASSPADATSSLAHGTANKNSTSSHPAAHTSRDPLSVYSAVTKRPRKVLASETSTCVDSSSLINKTSNSATNLSSAGQPAKADQTSNTSDVINTKGLMPSTIPASTASKHQPEIGSQTGMGDGKETMEGKEQKNRSLTSSFSTTQSDHTHDSEDSEKDVDTEKMPVFQPSATRERRTKPSIRNDKAGKLSSASAPASWPIAASALDTRAIPASLHGEADTFLTTSQPDVSSPPAEMDISNDMPITKGEHISGHSTVEDLSMDTSTDAKTGVGTKRKATESQVIRDKKAKIDATAGEKRQHQKDVQPMSSEREDNSVKKIEELSKSLQNMPTVGSDANFKPSLDADEVRNSSKFLAKSGKTNGSVLSVGNNTVHATSKLNETNKNTKPGGVLGGSSKSNKAGKAGNSGIGSVTNSKLNASSRMNINSRVNSGTKTGKVGGAPQKVPSVVEDVSGSIETVSSAAAAMAGMSGRRSGLKGAGGTLLSLSGGKAGRAVSPAMALLRKKMSEGIASNSNSNKGTSNGRAGSGSGTSNGVGTLPKAQREMLAQRGGVLALGTHTVGHRGGGLDGKSPIVGTEAGAGTKRSTGAASKSGKTSQSDVQFVPGSKSIKGVEPNGYTISDRGEVHPKVTLAARTRVPLKVRQTALDSLFKAWKDDAKASEADALQNCLQTEQEIYAGCAGRIDYRAAMAGKLKEIRTGTSEKGASANRR